jgi:nitrate/nitrite-specific signal transduction histidine kinase
MASAYMLSTSKIPLLDLEKNLPGLKSLLKHKQRLRALWQVTQDPVSKTAVNWVTKTIRQMTHRKALKRWEIEVGNCEVTAQVLWSIAKSLIKMDGPKAPIPVQGSLGITYHPNEKANMTADCLENHFTSHDLCYKNHEWQVETWDQALLASVDNLLGKVGPCDVHKLVIVSLYPSKQNDIHILHVH